MFQPNKLCRPEVVYSYNGIASIIGRALLTLLLGFTNIHIAIVMIFNYVVAQTSIFSAAFCTTLWEFRLQNFFSGFGIGAWGSEHSMQFFWHASEVIAKIFTFRSISSYAGSVSASDGWSIPASRCARLH